MTFSTQWTVPIDHPAFSGHFPGTPIMPGVVLLDIALNAIVDTSDVVLDTCEISSVKFLSPASPGDELTIQHTTAVNGADTVRFEIVAGSRKIAVGTIMTKLPI